MSPPRNNFFANVYILKQECIPVGCKPPTAVAVPGGSPHTHTLWEQNPPRPGTPRTRHPQGPVTPLEQTQPPWSRPPGADLPRSRTPQSRPPWPDPPQLPPWVWAWKPVRHAGIPPGDLLQGMLVYQPPCEQNS